MIRFYAPDIASTLTLPESESGHCARVLRHRAGDVIEVVDGAGHLCRCRITDPDPRRVAVAIEAMEAVPEPWEGPITLAVAPTKNADRMEWLVEKAVETGVDRIVPVRCDHSERRDLKTERLLRVAVAAMKQSLKARLPQIAPMTDITAFLDSADTADAAGRYIAYCDASTPRTLLSAEIARRRPGAVTLLIGPEGDFSPREVQAATGRGFVPVTLGDCRLRTETAALNALTTVHVARQIAAAPPVS